MAERTCLTRTLMLSHAQNGEDVVLSRVFADQERGFYVDIGACDPAEDSVTLHFYERGWRGVNVEPDQVLFQGFVLARPRDINLRAAIGQTRGQVSFHPTGTRGHGTLDASLASERSVGRPAERVPTMPLSDVLDCYGPEAGHIDFLKIDVEGWEAEVIASGDWTRHRPRVLVVEAVDDHGRPTHEAWEPGLLAAGYQFALYDGLNRFYCRSEDAGLLLPRLAAPANVRDGWMRAGDEHAHATAARLGAELAAAARQTAEAEAHAIALGLDLEDARDRERAAAQELAGLQNELDSLTADLEGTRLHIDALAVDATRARAEAAASLRREEAAETRMASLEMDLVRREAEERVLRAAHAQAVQQADSATGLVAALRASTSWRVTRPLRGVSRLLRGIRGGR